MNGRTKIWLKLGNGPTSELCSGAGVGMSIFFTYWRFWVGTPHPDAQTHTLRRAPAKSRGDCFLSVEPRPERKEEKRTGPLLFFWQRQFICDLNSTFFFLLFVYLARSGCGSVLREKVRCRRLKNPCRTESVRRWRPPAKNVPDWRTLSLFHAPLKYVKLCERPLLCLYGRTSITKPVTSSMIGSELFSQPPAISCIYKWQDSFVSSILWQGH